MFDWDWQGAEREFKLAIALNPNYAPAYSGYSYYFTAIGRLDVNVPHIVACTQGRYLLDGFNISLAKQPSYCQLFHIFRCAEKGRKELSVYKDTRQRFLGSLIPVLHTLAVRLLKTVFGK